MYNIGSVDAITVNNFLLKQVTEHVVMAHQYTKTCLQQLSTIAVSAM